MTSLSKNKLFIIGDSFGYWPFPKNKHWSDLMNEHYDVHNFAYGGASFAEICFQSTNVINHNKGDRLIVVVTEPTRFSSYISKYIKHDQKIVDDIGVGRYKDLERFRENKLNMKSMYENKHKNRHTKADAELYFLINLQNHYSILNPLYIAWNDYAYSLFSGIVDNLLLIKNDEYSTLFEEGLSGDNHHPGKKGNIVWFNKILDELNGKKRLRIVI